MTFVGAKYKFLFYRKGNYGIFGVLNNFDNKLEKCSREGM